MHCDLSQGVNESWKIHFYLDANTRRQNAKPTGTMTLNKDASAVDGLNIRAPLMLVCIFCDENVVI